MKRFAAFTLVILLSLSIVGCGTIAKVGENPVPVKSGDSGLNKGDVPKGITVNKINFTEVIEGDATSEVREFIDKYKTNRGYHYFSDDSGEITLVVFSGEKNTGGFGIKVQSIEDNEGKAVVIVKETSPDKDAIVTMALTYPVTIVKFKGTTTNFVVCDTTGEEIKPVRK